MAQVWKAWDPELERFVALKIIREGTEQEQKRFVVEARAAGSLHHPNIAGVHDFGDHDGFSYIAFEYIDGTTSWDAKPDIRRAVEIIRDSAGAVQLAHEQGIIHRDIKPSNIMVSKKGQTYVTDFGLARRISSREQLTLSGASIGTPSFMSPEQAEGRSHKVDAASDVYSLGATLYALLTRQAPFDGDSAFMVMLQVIRNDPLPPSNFNQDVNRNLETIIMKCLEKLPKNRYPTASDLADDLTRYLNQESIQAVPVTTIRRWSRKIFRRKELLTIVASLFLFASCLGFILWQNLGKEDVPVTPVDGQTSEETKEFQVRLQGMNNRIEKLRHSFYIEKVNLAGQLEELKIALEELESTLEGKPPAIAAPGWKMVGIGWYVFGNRTRAETSLLRAEQTLEKDPELRLHLGRIYLDRSRSIFLEEGATHVEDKVNPSSRWIAKAQNYFQLEDGTGGELAPGIDQDLIRLYHALTEGEKDLVLREAGKGWEKNSEELGSEEYLILQGMAAKAEDAIEDYTRAIKRRPHYDLGYFLLGWTWHTLGNHDKAWGNLNSAIRINPHLAIAYNERAEVEAHLGQSAAALKDYTRAIELNPVFANVYNNRGVFYFQLGEMKKALSDFNQVIRLEPTLVFPHNNRGTVYRNLGQDELAMKDFNTSIQLDPDHPSGYMYRGNLHLDREEYEEAIRDFTQGLVIAPRRPDILFLRAQARWELGDLEGALQDLNHTLEFTPPHPPAFLRRARVHENLEMWNEAIQDYHKATHIEKTAAEAHFHLGILLSRLGKREDGLTELTRCIDIDPEFEKVWFNRGIVNAYLGNLEEALSDYTRQIELSPGYAPSYYSRANLRSRMNDLEGALEDFTKAIELRPEFPDALLNRANTKRSLGKVSGAIKDYRAALRSAPPDWEFREKVKEIIRTLQKQ